MKPTIYMLKINLKKIEDKNGKEIARKVPESVVNKYLNQPCGHQYLPLSYDGYVKEAAKSKKDALAEGPSDKWKRVVGELLSLEPESLPEVNGGRKAKSAFKIFHDTEKGDLFWTKDDKDNYWICKVTGKPMPCWEPAFETEDNTEASNKITALLPVEAYCANNKGGNHPTKKSEFGREMIPGVISASFAAPGTIHRILAGGDKNGQRVVKLFSKYVFNKFSNRQDYQIGKKDLEDNPTSDRSLLAFFPPEVFEELVIAYIQDRYNLRVRIGSIVSSSGRNTTKSIECDFYITSGDVITDGDGNALDDEEHATAVVQVKAREERLTPDTSLDNSNSKHTYRTAYADKSHVFFYDGGVEVSEKYKNEQHFTWIKKEDLWSFYERNKQYWPSSVGIWQKLYDDIMCAIK